MARKYITRTASLPEFAYPLDAHWELTLNITGLSLTGKTIVLEADPQFAAASVGRYTLTNASPAGLTATASAITIHVAPGTAGDGAGGAPFSALAALGAWDYAVSIFNSAGKLELRCQGKAKALRDVGALSGVSGAPVVNLTVAAGNVVTVAVSTVGGSSYTHPNHTGDVSSVGDGATTIANNAVTFAKMQDITANHLIGRHASGNGDPQQVGIDGGLEMHGANLRRAALTGDVTAAAGGSSTSLANGVVTEAKCNASINASLDLADSSIQPGNPALTDARTPTAHKASHATGGADALTAADIGALASSAVSAFGATLLDDADAAIARATLGVGTSDTPTFSGVKIGGANGNILHGSGSGGYEIFWHPGNFWFLTRPDRTPILAAGVDRFIIANPTLQLGDTTDHGISRIGAGQIEVNNGTIGQRRDFFARAITAAESVRPGSYTVATVPAAATHTAGLIYVTDETGGAVPAFSDGVNWRRMTDRAIIS